MIGLLGSLVSSCQQSLDDEVQTPLNTPRAANISMCLVFDEQPVNSRNANEEPTWGKGEDNNNNEYNDDGTRRRTIAPIVYLFMQVCLMISLLLYIKRNFSL